MIAILLAILAFFGWGLGDSVNARVFRKNNPSTITVAGAIYRLLLWLILLPFFWNTFHTVTLVPAFYNLLAGFASGLGFYFFAKAVQRTNATLAIAISGAWGVCALLLSLVFLKEVISLQQFFAILVVFLELYLVTFVPRWIKEKKFFTDRGLVYALLAFVLWGICGTFLKIPGRAYGWYWTSVIMLIPYSLVVLLELRKVRLKDLLYIKEYKYFLLAIFCTALADFGYNGSFSFGANVAISGTIAGSYATNSTLLAQLFYREKMTKRQTIGIVITLIGIVLTAYFSSV